MPERRWRVATGGGRGRFLIDVDDGHGFRPATTPEVDAALRQRELFGAADYPAGGRAGQGRGLCLRRWGVRAAGGRSEADDSRHRGREGDRSLITSPLLRRSAEHLSRGGGRSGRLSIPGRSGAEAGR